MSTLPPELVELIVYDIWHSEMPSSMRQSFMTTCPRISRTWKNIYAPIASRDVYITNLAYLYYLCDVARYRKSIIYDDLVPRLTHTIICFANLRSGDTEAKRVYDILINLPNDTGFRALFPLTEFISFELMWIGGGLSTDVPEVHGLPIHVRCCRYLSKSAQKDKDARMEVYISIADPDPLSTMYRRSWSSAFFPLRDAGVPAKLVSSDLPYDRRALGGTLRFHQTAYVLQVKGDFEAINRRLWMAAKRVDGFRRLARPCYYCKYHWSQWCLPVLYSPHVYTASASSSLESFNFPLRLDNYFKYTC
ncbi:hypothetical protein ARMSODRAFT_231106 [Armillaria solidipes]|uniref:Uncharacterized protein n=1 Tax=Armillaria solidipes TaxID=1076256 RepID=A0A2H3C0D1_9AGAR|nr:hypothetical protein ARMSODRAFT_231106 [Armillaria solidipes]